MLNWEEPTHRWDEPLKRGRSVKGTDDAGRGRCETQPSADGRHWRNFVEFAVFLVAKLAAMGPVAMDRKVALSELQPLSASSGGGRLNSAP
jgi:hypothetical protein